MSVRIAPNPTPIADIRLMDGKWVCVTSDSNLSGSGSGTQDVTEQVTKIMQGMNMLKNTLTTGIIDHQMGNWITEHKDQDTIVLSRCIKDGFIDVYYTENTHTNDVRTKCESDQLKNREIEERRLALNKFVIMNLYKTLQECGFQPNERDISRYTDNRQVQSNNGSDDINNAQVSNKKWALKVSLLWSILMEDWVEADPITPHAIEVMKKLREYEVTR